ncbi:TetR/AcrR family transcriptional regulator [Rhodococcus sp. NPDC127530]|uniref:TetR/AcrR family transcriptional regulator n=1 Tax=unclassified Rhodococcus (in: high G+C Gram-positive bacteria) TaxID=192944 RepID=UPI003644754F
MTSARRRLAPEQRRAQLLDIGARLFADRPYEDVWIEEVAELAEVSRGLMYHYFPTKRDFFAAIVERESERLLDVTAPDSTLPVEEQVAAGLDAYFEHVASHRHGVRAINRGALSADSDIRAIVDRELDAQQRRIVDALDPPGSERELVGVAVRGWIAFVRAVCMDWLDHPSIAEGELRELCLRSLRGMLGGRLD